jgi:hypothetical protein
MSFRAHSLDITEHPCQNKVQRRAAKLLKRSKLAAQLDALADELTPFVMAEMGLDATSARKRARQWAIEAACELLAAPIGDVVFIE